jgi:hypothetical protein
MAAGKQAEACPKFEESQRLDPGSGTLMNLARCYEETNRLASAWSTYLEAAVAARSTRNEDRENAAREFAASLAPRIAKLVIDVPAPARLQGLEITRDGTPTGAAQWGLGIPADAGEHTVVAKAPGHGEWRGVAVVSGEGTTTTLTVPLLPEEAVPPSTAGAAKEPKADETSGGLGTQRIAALVVGGVGVVGVGVGTAFGLMSKSNHDEAAKYCNGGACTDPRGVTAGTDAHSQGTVATVAMVVGLAGLGAGAALWFTAPKSDAPAQVGLGLDGVHVKGVF